MDLVVVEREQREILQVLEGVGAYAVNLIGIQQPEGVDKHMEGGRKEGRKSGSTCQSFFMRSFIIHSSWETMHRYKVYFKVTTPLVSGSKICRRGIQD